MSGVGKNGGGMSRPKKATVDYFPHYVNQKRSIKILKHLYGNNGYAFFFQLLEILGRSDGHVYNFKESWDQEYLASETGVGLELCKEILNKLAHIEVIDLDLLKVGIIWSQAFVDDLNVVYVRRKIEKPAKPIKNVVNEEGQDPIYAQKIWCRNATNKAIIKGHLTRGLCEICGTSENIEAHHEDYSDPYNVKWLCNNHHNKLTNGINVDNKPVEQDKDAHNVNNNPQSIVKYSKLPPLPPLDSPPDSPPQKPPKPKRVKVSVDYSLELKKALEAFSPDMRTPVQAFVAVVASLNKTQTISQARELSLLGELSGVSATAAPDVFRYAILEATTRKKDNIGYIKAIIKRKMEEGVNGSAAQAADDAPPRAAPSLRFYENKDHTWTRVDPSGDERRVSKAEMEAERKAVMPPPNPVTDFVHALVGAM